jgi:hypothetical protein
MEIWELKPPGTTPGLFPGLIYLFIILHFLSLLLLGFLYCRSTHCQWAYHLHRPGIQSLISNTFWSASAKLLKATIRSVCPHETTPLHWKDFHEIWNLNIFRKSVKKIQVSLKPVLNNADTLCEDQYTFKIISRRILLRMRNISHESFRENQNAHFMFNNFFSKVVSFMR